MDEEAVLCRVCLTTEDGEIFKPLTEEILKKVAFSLNVSITAGSAAVICRKCEADIAAAWRTCSRILDAHDYFESLQSKRKAVTKPATNTFDKCSLATFGNRKSLGAHVAQHDSDCEIVENFNCFFCKHSFTSAKQRKLHLSSHHSLELEKFNALCEEKHRNFN